MATPKITSIDYAAAIATILRLSTAEALALKKAGIEPLRKIFEALANSRPIQ